MRQDARHRSPRKRQPRTRPAATHADEARAFAGEYRPATLGRIGPPTLPPSPEVDWHERGVAHELACNFHGAIESYENALRARGPDAQVVFDLAHVLAEAGDRDRAAERYRQVIELDAGRADAWNNLGVLLAEAGDAAAAEAAFAIALRLLPDDHAIRRNLAATLCPHNES